MSKEELLTLKNTQVIKDIAHQEVVVVSAIKQLQYEGRRRFLNILT